MAEKPQHPFKVAPIVRPSEASVRRPSSYANTVWAAADPSGVTIAFYCVPPNLGDLPEGKEALASALGPGETRQVPVTLDAIAKVWLPGEVVTELLRVLGAEQARHLAQKAAREEDDRDAAR